MLRTLIHNGASLPESLKKKQHCRNFISTKETKMLDGSITPEHGHEPLKAISTELWFSLIFLRQRWKGHSEQPGTYLLQYLPSYFPLPIPFLDLIHGPQYMKGNCKPGTRCVNSSAEPAHGRRQELLLHSNLYQPERWQGENSGKAAHQS